MQVDQPLKAKRDFRLFLQDEFARRCSQNPNYSLRSFAKYLAVSPSALSALLSGKRPITHQMKERLGLRLGLELEDLKKLKAKVHGNTKLKSESESGVNFQQVTIDTFSIISAPYHYALLELTKTKDFNWDCKWIAQRLQITISEAKFAIERLERVGLLERDKNGQLFDTTDGFSTDIREGLSTHGQRRFQESSLGHAIAAVKSVPVELRDNTSMTMAIDVADLPKAKQLIKEFRRRFCTRLESNPNLNEVYQLSVSFVPLTDLKKGKK